MIAHGNVTLNGRRMDIPSAIVSVGDLIAPGKRESTKAAVKKSFEERAKHVPAWLSRDDAGLEGKVTGLPTPQGRPPRGQRAADRRVLLALTSGPRRLRSPSRASGEASEAPGERVFVSARTEGTRRRFA